MTLKDVQKIPLKEKKFMIHEICVMYRKLRKTNIENVLNDSAKRVNEINNKTVSMFDTIISLLPTDYATVIETEFINNKKLRWDEYPWSKTTYYNIRTAAINQFLYLFFA